MEPVLVFTDTERIQTEKNLCDASVSFIQGFYDLIVPLGITFNIEEMTGTSYLINNDPRTKKPLEDLVKQKLLIKVSGSNFNGVALSDDFLEKSIALPDVSHIVAYIKLNYPKFYVSSQIWITPALIELNNGIVSKKANAFTTIEELYTYYTKNDKGAELATMLFSICDKLNEYENFLGRIPNPYPLIYQGVTKGVEGVEFVGLIHRPKLKTIREAEALYPDYVAL